MMNQNTTLTSICTAVAERIYATAILVFFSFYLFSITSAPQKNDGGNVIEVTTQAF